jgi:hypothetical protein
VYLSAEYRFYAGYHMLHHGYFGYDFNENNKLHMGVHQVPFGIQPYASHNWFFQLPYYVGLEDDYDAGLKYLLDMDKFHLALAWYMNDEGSYTGNSLASARYSYDIVPATAGETSYFGVDRNTYQNEHNQFNLRLAYDLGKSEIGASGQYGQLYNSALDEMGDRFAWAVHGNLNFGRVNIKAEVIGYQFNPALPETDDPNTTTDETDDTWVIQGAYDFPYAVAADAMFYVGGISYGLPVDIGPISKLTFYENYTMMQKTEDAFEPSQNIITGVMVTAGSVYTYIDVAMGKNHPWLGPNYGSALAAGNPEADWWTRFNINMGYYF